jgi:hypothetical protein
MSLPDKGSRWDSDASGLNSSSRPHKRTLTYFGPAARNLSTSFDTITP